MKQLGLAATLLLGLGGTALADDATTPPKTAVSVLEAEADGVQIYVCETKDSGFAWVFHGPEANLFDAQGRQIGTHFAGPSWKLADGSTVVGEKLADAPAPEPHAVPWLLLRAKTHEGTGQLTAAAWIRRANTRGGTAPVGGCDAGHAGETARIRYSATYQFFR